MEHLVVKNLHTGTTADKTNVFIREVKILSEIKHDYIVAIFRVCEKPVPIIVELCEFDFEPFNADKKVSSLGEFLLHINKEDIFDSFLGIRNVIASDVVHQT